MSPPTLGSLMGCRDFLTWMLALAGSATFRDGGTASSLAPAGGATAAESTPLAAGETANLQLEVEPGFYYDLVLPEPDGIEAGTRWGRSRPAGPQAAAGPLPLEPRAGPLEPMYRKRFILQVDDLATWSLPSFQQFATVIEKHNAKADLGIIPGQSGPEVFAWVRTLDPHRFEIWNHTWDHGKSGPNHYEQPYDVQYRNIDRGQQLVKQETGITMRGWCGSGIQYQGQGLHDQDEVTHIAVRNHPDLVVHFHANREFADQGYGRINSEGLFMPWRFSWFENEAYDQNGAIADSNFIRMIQQKYPDEDPHRPLPIGNAEEMIWRLEHPFWNVPETGEIGSMVAQFHPSLWTSDRRQGPYEWTAAQALGSLEALLDYIQRGHAWRFANAYETYRWLKDRDLIALEKTAPDRYRLEAQWLHFPHHLELALPPAAVVEAHAYHIRSFEFP